MKIRECFVSNSSSSSFCIISDSKKKAKLSQKPWKFNKMFIHCNKWNNPSDKLNFCMLFGCIQAPEDKKYIYEKMIQKFCEKHNIVFDIYYETMLKYFEEDKARIDHQSTLWEEYHDCDMIEKVFCDYESFENFIINPESYLVMEWD